MVWLQFQSFYCNADFRGSIDGYLDFDEQSRAGQIGITQAEDQIDTILPYRFQD